MKKNPFDISFGKKPAEAISTILQIREIADVFTNDPITQQIALITGVRGSGKTVLMNTIANLLEQEKEWVVLRLNPERDLLVAMGAKLCSHSACQDIFRNAKLNLSLFGVGIEWQGTAPISDIETALEEMLNQLKKHKKRVLVTIDEITSNAFVRSFCSSFQILIGQELPVFLLMTGLYENIEELQNEKTLTFLYRAPKIRMTPLNLGRIASRYKEIFSLSEDDAAEMAMLTRGYAFAFQALGYCCWNHGGKLAEALEDYRQLLEDFVYEKIWSELSPKDKRIAAGIAHCPDGKTGSIVSYLGLKPDEINQYRRRLIRKGIVNGDEYGILTFTLPLFDRFVLEQERMGGNPRRL